MDWWAELKIALVFGAYFLGMAISYLLVCARKWYCTILGLLGFYVTLRGLWSFFQWVNN